MLIRIFLSSLLLTLLCTCGRAPDTNGENGGQSNASAPRAQPQGAPVTIRQGRQTATIDLRTGGRLASFTLRGKEVLKTTRDEDGLQWGSTVWTSPQSAWAWPPEATFDRQAFVLTDRQPHSVTVTSAVDSATQLQMQKIFAFVRSGKSGVRLQCTYELYNRGETPVTRGLWENTRLPYGGEFSFVADSIRVQHLSGDFEVRGKATVVRMAAGDREKGKLFVHPSTGKATYAGRGIRLRKLWYADEQPGVAPGQAPLEIYLDPESGFAEFEVQGPYRPIEPGGLTSLTVAWQVAELVAED